MVFHLVKSKQHARWYQRPSCCVLTWGSQRILDIESTWYTWPHPLLSADKGYALLISSNIPASPLRACSFICHYGVLLALPHICNLFYASAPRTSTTPSSMHLHNMTSFISTTPLPPLPEHGAAAPPFRDADEADRYDFISLIFFFNHNSASVKWKHKHHPE